MGEALRHGIHHAQRVASLAAEIADEENGDPLTAYIAGLFHDCGRVESSEGRQHALDSAEIALFLLYSLRDRGCLIPDFEERIDIAKLRYAISDHADGLTTEDPTIGAVWDADRLELVRVGRKVDMRLLSTQAARRRLTERNKRK